MGIHAIYYYEEPEQRELVDIEYQCSALCMRDELEQIDDTLTDSVGDANLPNNRSISWGATPGGSETDYDVHCSSCKELLWRGLSAE
jgi:hypothetical protein